MTEPSCKIALNSDNSRDKEIDAMLVVRQSFIDFHASALSASSGESINDIKQKAEKGLDVKTLLAQRQSDLESKVELLEREASRLATICSTLFLYTPFNQKSQNENLNGNLLPLLVVDTLADQCKHTMLIGRKLYIDLFNVDAKYGRIRKFFNPTLVISEKISATENAIELVLKISEQMVELSKIAFACMTMPPDQWDDQCKIVVEVLVNLKKLSEQLPDFSYYAINLDDCIGTLNRSIEMDASMSMYQLLKRIKHHQLGHNNDE